MSRRCKLIGHVLISNRISTAVEPLVKQPNPVCQKIFAKNPCMDGTSAKNKGFKSKPKRKEGTRDSPESLQKLKLCQNQQSVFAYRNRNYSKSKL